MPLKLKRFKKTVEDLKSLDDLFDLRQWPHWDHECVPKLSFFASNNERIIAFGGCYVADSSTAFMGFFVTDPATTKEERDSALDLIYWNIEKALRKKKIRYVPWFSDSAPMVKRMEKDYGYTVTDRGTGYILIKDLANDYGIRFFDE